MQEIINILMERDGMTKREALDLIKEVKEMMEECNYDPEECEEIFTSEIGLELDYIPGFLLS